MSVSNRLQRGACAIFAVVLSLGLVSCSTDNPESASGEQTSVKPELGQDGQKVVDIIEKQMKELDLTGAVYGVWRDDEVIAVGAAGSSPVGVPATPDMKLRIGQPMEPMLSTVLLQLDGEGVIDQNAPISKYLPDFPLADQITPKMLADSTSGVSDYVTDPAWNAAFYENPIKGFTAEELIGYANSRPRAFDPPGSKFADAHSDLVLLGEILQKASGKSLGELLQERIFDPLQMADTRVQVTPQIEEPFLHGYTNERGMFEDSSFWNPTAFLHSGNANTTVADVRKWIRGLADGALLSDEQHKAMMAPNPLPPFTAERFFGYGVLHTDGWFYMNPAYGGYHGAVFYDTETKTMIILYVTLGPTSDAAPDNALPAATEIGTMLIPDRPPAL